MNDADCVSFLQWALPRLQMRWRGFRKVRRQVCKRVDRRLRELMLPDVKAYRVYLEAHQEEWSVLDSFCRISISRFYRDRGVFDYLRDDVLPMVATMAQARGQSSLWCWSAGCASGEEAFTLNAVWKLSVGQGFPELTLKVVGTDSDRNMLDRAREGLYSKSSLKDFPHNWLSTVFTQGDGLFRINSEFRANVEWRLQDIRHEMPSERFHLIVCRHLAFTYFDEPLQCRILDRIIARLTPGGVLVTGKQERLPRLPVQLREVGYRMAVYQRDDHLPANAGQTSHGWNSEHEV